jgi:hypothetical protein
LADNLLENLVIGLLLKNLDIRSLNSNELVEELSKGIFNRLFFKIFAPGGARWYISLRRKCRSMFGAINKYEGD